jgi:hypothetical protein
MNAARKLIGWTLAALVLSFIILSAIFAVMTVSTLAHAGTMPPMPANCTTAKTMNVWYGKVAQQNLLAHRSPMDCKAKLEGLGATPGVAGRACS